MCSITGNAVVFSVELMKEQVIPEPAGLRSNLLAVWASERASSSMVGTVMALLATFEEAGVLLPEGTAQANQLIHGLIQLQSALTKSSSPELLAYGVAAEKRWATKYKEAERGPVSKEGLTSRVLGALVLYDKEHPMWEDPKIVLALRAFNLTRSDWILIVQIFHKAERVFREEGYSIYKVYDEWRGKMPGGKP